MQPTLLSQGLELLLFGMGTVVVFLTLLVYAIGVMSWLIRTFLPAPELPASPAAAAHTGVTHSPYVSPQILAAIVGAVHQHRESRRTHNS